MFKYETHLHTAEGSECGKAGGADYAQLYKELGYDGVIVTDHFYQGNTRPDRSLPWEEFVRQYAEGYYKLKEAAKGELDVFFGVEERFENLDEFLIYGLTPEWFMAHPELRDADRDTFLSTVKSHGAFVIQAHPFRYRDYYKGNTVHIFPKYADGIEVINASNTKLENELAYKLAKDYGKAISGGSDRHRIVDTSYLTREEKTPSGIMISKKATCIEDIIDAIRSGDAVPIGLDTLTGDTNGFDLNIEIHE